ncbi:MAG TPA: hypothetical protein VEJ43_04915 [Pseudolabrys sp.]|nr:hypothetical protein [Pseudolabrys sp.]
MALVTLGLMLTAFAALCVWLAADRLWHGLLILVLGLILFPVVASWLTGDVSRYFPAGSFPEGADGKDQIVLASATATIFVAFMLAACIWAAAAAIWRRLQRK